MVARSRLLKLVTALTFAALVAVGCEEQEITSEPGEPAAEEPADDEQTQPEGEDGSPMDTDDGEEDRRQATVGDPITLRGNEEGLQIAVTVQEILDPAEPKEQFMAPAEGEKFVAVRLQLENEGESNYQDSPGNGATLISEANEQ